jgi:hypothetical protein
MSGAHLKPPLPELEARRDWLRALPGGSGHDTFLSTARRMA